MWIVFFKSLPGGVGFSSKAEMSYVFMSLPFEYILWLIYMLGFCFDRSPPFCDT